MKKGIIIYAPEDVDVNKRFVNICRDITEEKGIALELEVLKDKKQTELDCELLREATDGNIAFAINRSRNAKVAMQLEARGVRVFNSSRVTEIANDKWLTYKYARKHGIEVMETWSMDKDDEKCELEYPRVIKSCDGHGGKEVFLVEDDEKERDVLKNLTGKYIVQKLADARGVDIRAYVLGKEVVVAMRRQSKEGFKSNFSLGGVAEEYSLREKEKEIINKIAGDLEADYIGIDLIYDGERIVLNEIEDAVGARMVYENTSVPIIEMYMEYVLNNCKS